MALLHSPTFRTFYLWKLPGESQCWPMFNAASNIYVSLFLQLKGRSLCRCYSYRKHPPRSQIIKVQTPPATTNTTNNNISNKEQTITGTPCLQYMALNVTPTIATTTVGDEASTLPPRDEATAGSQQTDWVGNFKRRTSNVDPPFRWMCQTMDLKDPKTQQLQ